jgi:SagB-type dehydrogenase family enzyme
MMTFFVGGHPMAQTVHTETIELPAPSWATPRPIHKVLESRRSVRSYDRSPLSLEEVATLLWAAQGITGPDGERTAPSAGGLYPLEVYLVAGRVEDLADGIYRYDPRAHGLIRVGEKSRRADLAHAALGQDCVRTAPAMLVLAGVLSRTTSKYRSRSLRYVHMESGAAAENVYLAANALGLGTVLVGAFDDASVKDVLGLRKGEEPLILLPVGRPR